MALLLTKPAINYYIFQHNAKLSLKRRLYGERPAAVHRIAAFIKSTIGLLL